MSWLSKKVKKLVKKASKIVKKLPAIQIAKAQHKLLQKPGDAIAKKLLGKKGVALRQTAGQVGAAIVGGQFFGGAGIKKLTTATSIVAPRKPVVLPRGATYRPAVQPGYQPVSTTPPRALQESAANNPAILLAAAGAVVLLIALQRKE